TAAEIETLVADIGRQSHEYDLPLFLEPLAYSLDPQRKKLAPDERQRVVLETARRLTAIAGDVLKAEFPLDAEADGDERNWVAACAELSMVSAIPWVLLS